MHGKRGGGGRKMCEEGGTGNARWERTVEWISRQRREDTRKVAEVHGWEKEDILFLGLI